MNLGRSKTRCYSTAMLFVDARGRTDIDLSVGFATIEAMKHVSPYRNSGFSLRLP